jgi:WD40 repeat protein
LLASVAIGAEPAKVDRFGDPLPEGAVARLGTTRLRHESADEETRLFAFADDTRLISAAGKRVCVWDIRSGARINCWETHGWGDIGQIAVSPGGKMIAVAAGPGVLLGNVGVKSELRELGASNLPAGWIGFTSDSASLVIIERNGAIRVAGLNPIAPPRSAAGNNPHPLAGISRDGKTLTVWRQDRVERWDLAKLDKPSTTKFPFLGFRRLRMRGEGSLLAIHVQPHGVVFWDPAADKEVGRLADGKLIADDGADFTPDGKQFVTVTRGVKGTVKVWDVATGKLAWSFELLATEVGEPVISPDGRAVVFATPRAAITPRDLKTGRPLFDRGELEVPAAGLSFLPGGKVLAAGGRQLYIWERASGRPVRGIELPVEPVTGLAADPAGQFAVVSSTSLSPRRLDLATGQVSGEFALPASTLINTNGLALTGDGRTLCALASKGPRSEPVRLNWDAHSRQPGQRWDLRTAQPEPFFGRYGPSPHSLLTGTYRIAGMPGQRPPPGTGLASVEERWLEVHALADDTLWMRVEPAGVLDCAAAGGPVLAVVSWAPHVEIGGDVSDDSVLEIWDVASGEQLLKMRGGNWKRWVDNPQWAIAAAPDGRTLALVRGATIVLRDVDSGAELLKRGAGSTVRRLTFSTDGRWLASAQDDATILIWDVAAVTRRGIMHLLSPEAVAACWEDLGRDAKTARRSADRLAGDPAQAVALLHARLKPAEAVDNARIKRLIADLDSPHFAARQTASRELRAIGARAAGALQAAHIGGDSAELQRRLDKILSEPFLARTPDELRTLRGVDLLERLGTPAAKAVLTKLSRGDATARETQAAQAALQRLAGD